MLSTSLKEGTEEPAYPGKETLLCALIVLLKAAICCAVFRGGGNSSWLDLMVQAAVGCCFWWCRWWLCGGVGRHLVSDACARSCGNLGASARNDASGGALGHTVQGSNDLAHEVQIFLRTLRGKSIVLKVLLSEDGKMLKA